MHGVSVPEACRSLACCLQHGRDPNMISLPPAFQGIALGSLGPEVQHLQKALGAATGLVSAHTTLPPPPSILKEQLRSRKLLYPEPWPVVWFMFGFARPKWTHLSQVVLIFQQRNLQDPARLRQEIDDWMQKYDERQEEKRRLAKETQMDDDGFTKVVSGITRTPDGLTIRGARRPSLKTGAFGESMTSASLEPAGGFGKKKKKKSKEMLDFYRFQQREKRREELIDHRKRNRKDLETVKQMKKAGALISVLAAGSESRLPN